MMYSVSCVSECATFRRAVASRVVVVACCLSVSFGVVHSNACFRYETKIPNDIPSVSPSFSEPQMHLDERDAGQLLDGRQCERRPSAQHSAVGCLAHAAATPTARLHFAAAGNECGYWQWQSDCECEFQQQWQWRHQQQQQQQQSQWQWHGKWKWRRWRKRKWGSRKCIAPRLTHAARDQSH